MIQSQSDKRVFILNVSLPSGGECIVGETTYQEGEVWSAEGGCKGFVCQEDGSTADKR